VYVVVVALLLLYTTTTTWSQLGNYTSHKTLTTTTTTTTTHLTALYPGRRGWAGTRRNIHSLTPCLCGYYTTSSHKPL